jgi:hypothetical protein
MRIWRRRVQQPPSPVAEPFRLDAAVAAGGASCYVKRPLAQGHSRSLATRVAVRLIQQRSRSAWRRPDGRCMRHIRVFETSAGGLSSGRALR